MTPWTNREIEVVLDSLSEQVEELRQGIERRLSMPSTVANAFAAQSRGIKADLDAIIKRLERLA